MDELTFAVITCTDEIEGDRYVLLVEYANGLGWGLPGGFVEPGRDSLQTALLLVAEQAGLVLSPLLNNAVRDETFPYGTLVRCDLDEDVDLPALGQGGLGGGGAARQAMWEKVSNVIPPWNSDIHPGHREMLRKLL